MSDQAFIPNDERSLPTLLVELGQLIRQARQRALREVDTIQVQTCWEIGHHIVQFEQGGATRATYGKRLLPELASALTTEFGKGFDERNLRNMRGFYLAFPIRNALRTELSWTHYRTLLRVDSENARAWYMNEATAWAWAAGVSIGLKPGQIIQDDEYDGDGASIRSRLQANQYAGINGLAHAGMCKRGAWVPPEARYPNMTAWLQAAD